MSSRALLALLIAPVLWAQQPLVPHVGYVYPAGGRVGTKFEVTVGGQSLDGVDKVYVSGPGVQAVVLKHVKPLTPAQFNKLREQAKELMDKRSAGTSLTAEEQKLVAELRQKIATSVRRPATPAIAEHVTLEITLAPNAAPGERELRLATPNGLTNPLVFSVGQLPEFSKEPAKVVSELPTPKIAKKSEPPKTSAAPMSITLPSIVNGQVVPGGVDRFRFQAVKGQRLVVAASARQLIPYISDAVPGWFQATLALYDAQGKQVDYADHFLFHPDPVLYYEIPADGEYVLEIRDSIYRGREDFVYRIAVGELPFITGMFPLGGKTGARTKLEIKGWNLPVAKLTENSKHRAAGIYSVSVRKGEWFSNHVPFAVDTLPERLEKESKNAQRVKLPLIVNGRIDRPGEWDVFRFDGRAGDEIVAEVFARRLDSPLDSVLKLTDATGRQLAFNDDFEDKGAGLITHQADSRILFRLPTKGTYYLHLGDTQQKGGPEYVYRLRISHPEPDFALRVVPSTINVRPGMTVPITVYALRQDGFTGEIALRLTDAPSGFVLSGATVPPNQDKIRLTITAPPGRIDQPSSLYLEGAALIEGREIRRPGVPAEDMMQAFAYRHLVPTKDWMISVNGPGRAATAWKLIGAMPVKIPGRLFLPLGRFANEIQLALNDPPEGISMQVSPQEKGVSLQLRADPHKSKPGLRGNLIVDAFRETTVTPKNGGAPVKRRQPLGALPAIPFEIPYHRARNPATPRLPIRYTQRMLLCPVRNCHAALVRGKRRLFCARGHSFDVARSGYINLLQPQDRRSKQPGDTTAALAARRRLHDRGVTGPLLDAIAEMVAASPADIVLDAGCGDGFYLGTLARQTGFSAHGVDISVPAIDAAARSYRECEWIVANADRFLPYADRSFSIVLSITARMNASEFRRVLRQDGRLLVALPAPGDLVELRGAGRDRAARTVRTFAHGFTLLDRRRVTTAADLDAAAVHDVLLSIYRPMRSQPVQAMRVTFSLDLLLFGATPA